MKIYIDIDGVLLTKSKQIPQNGRQFITFLTVNYDCYWLTTHCRTGENKALSYLENYYDKESILNLQKIKKTDWIDKKTEAIDFRSNFIWLDDYPFNAEKKVLEENNSLKNLFVVDLNNENELAQIKIKIKNHNLVS